MPVIVHHCIIDAQGNVLKERNIKTDPEAFLKLVADYRDELVTAVKCMFTWYWLADLCSWENIYNLPTPHRKFAYKANREGVADLFPDPSVQKSIQLDLDMLDSYDRILPRLEHEISLIAKAHDADSYFRTGEKTR